MTINFTGIKNTGSFKLLFPKDRTENIVFSTVLTDDDKGADFKEYSEKFEEAGIPLNKFCNNMLSIEVKRKYPENTKDSFKHSFLVNGTKLECNDQNLPIFSYLAKLTKNISEMEDDEIIQDRNYTNSSDFRHGMVPEGDMKVLIEKLGPDYKVAAEVICAKESAKLGAKDVMDSTQYLMEEYFGVPHQPKQ